MSVGKSTEYGVVRYMVGDLVQSEHSDSVELYVLSKTRFVPNSTCLVKYGVRSTILLLYSSLYVSDQHDPLVHSKQKERKQTCHLIVRSEFPVRRKVEEDEQRHQGANRRSRRNQNTVAGYIKPVYDPLLRTYESPDSVLLVPTTYC